jgi:hypothetical protein
MTGNHIFSQYPFSLRSDPLQGATGRLVVAIRFEFNPNATVSLERLSQQQEFRLGVDGGSLPGNGDPGEANFQSAMEGMNVMVTSRSDDFIRFFFQNDKGKREILFPFLKRFPHVLEHVFRGFHSDRREPPQTLVQSDFA